MGARTITITNNKVLEITADVVKRINDPSKSKSDSSESFSQEESNKSEIPGSPNYPVSTPQLDQKPKTYTNPQRDSSIIYNGEPTITALEVRRQKEKELENNDQYWKKRITQMEQTYEKMNSISEKEYNAAIEDVRKQFLNAPPQLQLPPCQDFKAKVIECYKKHSNESLMCAREVADFSNCINANRIKILAERKKSEEKGKNMSTGAPTIVEVLATK